MCRSTHFSKLLLHLQALMHNSCTIFCLTKAKVFLPPWLTLLIPEQKFALSQRGQKPSAATHLSSAEDNGRKCTHIKELKKYHLQLQQVYYVCVWTYTRACVCIVCASAYEQCWLHSSIANHHYWKNGMVSISLGDNACRVTFHPLPPCLNL